MPLPLLGEDVEVDVGPVVREALVCYVNKELLIPEKAAVPGPAVAAAYVAGAAAVAATLGTRIVAKRVRTAIVRLSIVAEAYQAMAGGRRSSYRTYMRSIHQTRNSATMAPRM